MAGAAVVGVLVLAITVFRPAKGGNGASPGRQAPLFASTDLSGQPVVLSAYRGHRVILNFWASWCVPCRAEFPVLRQLKDRHRDVVVLGVVFDDVDRAAGTFLRSEGATWPGVHDPNAQIANAYGVHAKPGIPVSILIDPSGRVVDHHVGPIAAAAADTFVNQAPAASP